MVSIHPMLMFIGACQEHRSMERAVSIHPMLMFIKYGVNIYDAEGNSFNTSYVNVYHCRFKIS